MDTGRRRGYRLRAVRGGADARTPADARHRRHTLLLEQVEERACLLGKTIPVERIGDRVRFSSGRTVQYVADYNVWRSGLRARYDLHDSRDGEPPRAMNQYSRAELLQWLEDHPPT